MISFVLEEEGETRRLDLPAAPVHIGRSPDAEVSLASQRSSRHHARIEASREGFVLVDLDSSNGTFCNGERVRRVLIHRGDRIDIGDSQITFLGGELPPVVPEGGISLPGFSILDELGEGVLSRVYLARQEAMDRKVAIKILRQRWLASLSVTARFQRLARRQARIHHPGLASGIDVGERDGVPYFVLEYIEGDSLEGRVRRSMAPAPAETIRILDRLLEVLTHVHGQGQVIGHLHPGAVMIGDAGEIWLASLGFPFPSVRGYPAEFARELAYLAPEALGDPDGAGVSGDLHQVGMLASFLITGKHPHEGGTPEEILAGVAAGEKPELEGRRRAPLALRSWVESLLDDDLAQRPATAEEARRGLAAVARELAEGTLVGAAAADGEERPPPPPSIRDSTRFKVLNWAIFGVLLIGSNLGLFFWWEGHQREVRAEQERAHHEARVRRAAELRAQQMERVAPHRPAATALRREAAAAAWPSLASNVETLRGRGELDDARALLRDFEQRYRGTTEGERALQQLQAIQKEVIARARGALEELEDRIDAGDLDGARRAHVEAQRVAAAVDPTQLELLTTRLAELGAAGRPPPASGAPDSPPGAGSGTSGSGDSGAGDAGSDGAGADAGREAAPAGPPLLPLAEARRLVTEALSRPGASELHAALLEGRDRIAELPRLENELRLLAALHGSMEELRGRWRLSVGEQIELALEEDSKASGVLVAVEGDSLVLEQDGARTTVLLDRIALTELVERLAALPPSLDHYLGRAHLSRLADRAQEEWFDLQAAGLMAGDDATARAIIDERLAALRAANAPGER